MIKVHKPKNRNRDAPDCMDVPDQAPCGHSNKPTFSQIPHALPELWLGGGQKTLAVMGM